MAWLTGWGYRKSHLINAAVGAGTNYQVGIKVYKGSGADGTEVVNGVTMGKVYCNNHCRDDFGDIRFTDNDGESLLDLWQDLDLLVSGVSSVFWGEVADTLESDATIYVYYGKSDATSVSNGFNTFVDFDDFEDGVVDANWAKYTYDGNPTAITVTEASGKLTLTHANGNRCIMFFVKNNVTRNTPVCVVARINTKNYAADTKLFGPALYRTISDNVWAGTYDYTNYQADVQPNLGTHYHAADSISANIIYEWQLIVDNSYGAKQYRDGANKASANVAAAKKADGKLGLLVWYSTVSSVQTIEVSVWFVRKYVAIGNSEPAHSTWGSEETPVVTPTVVTGSVLEMGED